MLGLKSKVVGSATLSSRWLQQSTIPVKLHIINTHAGGPSQFGESERPRSHIPPTSKKICRPGRAGAILVLATNRGRENIYVQLLAVSALRRWPLECNVLHPFPTAAIVPV
jgi:hypothetical protein